MLRRPTPGVGNLPPEHVKAVVVRISFSVGLAYDLVQGVVRRSLRAVVRVGRGGQ